MTTPSPDAPMSADEVLDRDDFGLFGHIHGMYQQADPVPADLYTRVRFAIDLESAERELATVRRDLEPDLVVRGTEQTRTITFEAENVTITITITPDDNDTTRIDGWLLPAARLDVEVRSFGQRRRTSSDDSGRFVIDGVPPGEMQLAVLPTPGSTVSLSCVIVTQPIVLGEP